MFFDELPDGQTVEIYTLDLSGDAEEGAAVRAPHSEVCGHLIPFGNHFLQRPLNIGKAPSHHTDDCEVTRRTSQRLGTSRDIEYRFRGDELCSELLAGGVDELRKTAHDEFVKFLLS